MRVLLIEDDESLSLAVEYRLRKEKIEVVRRIDGEGGLAAFEEEGPFDIVLLDRMLPGLKGIFVLDRIRQKGDATPVLIVTVMDGIGDRVEGLNAGADDYLVKPFAMDELVARVRALARRSSGWSTPRIELGDLKMDVQRRMLICGARKKGLTRRGADLMELLMKNRGKVLSRDLLMSRIWADRIVEEGNLDIMIHYLRKHLSEIGSAASIRTIRGVGYLFVTEPEGGSAP